MLLTKGFWGKKRGTITLGTVQTVLCPCDVNIMVSAPPPRIYIQSKYHMKTCSSPKYRLTSHVSKLWQYFESTLQMQLASDMECREVLFVDRVDLSLVRKENFQYSFFTSSNNYFLGNEGWIHVSTHSLFVQFITIHLFIQ